MLLSFVRLCAFSVALRVIAYSTKLLKEGTELLKGVTPKMYNLFLSAL